MEKSEKVIITNMCMVYTENKVLVQNKVGGSWNGLTFPGGHVEKKESFADAVIREVYEETGLTIATPQLCGIKQWQKGHGVRYIVLFYKTDKFSGEIKSSNEGEVFWMEFDEFRKGELAPDMDDMLKVFLQDDLSEFYYYPDKENGKWKYELK